MVDVGAEFLAWVLMLTEVAAGVSLLLVLLTPFGAAGVIGIAWQFRAGLQWDNGLFGNQTGASGFDTSTSNSRTLPAMTGDIGVIRPAAPGGQLERDAPATNAATM